MKERKNRNIQIKTISNIQNQNYFPSKYIKEKYPQLNKVVPKHSILHKVKYKPDLDNEKTNFFSNNKSINIQKNIFVPLSTKNGQNNNIPEKKHYEINTNNSLLNYLDENDINYISSPKYYEDSPIHFSENKPVNNNENSFQNFLIERNNLNNEFIINPIIVNENAEKEKKIFKNRITKDYGYNNTNYLKIDENTSIFNNIEEIKINSNNIEEININNSNNNNSNCFENTSNNNNRKHYNNNLYLKYVNNNLDNNKSDYGGHHTINSNNFKYFHENESSYKSQLNERFFSPKNILNKTIENKNKNDIINISNNMEATNKGLNIKLNFYRIRLFNVFFKYFQKYCRMRLKKYFKLFFDKINNNNTNANYNTFVDNNNKINYNNTSINYNYNTIVDNNKKNYNKPNKIIFFPNRDIIDDMNDTNNKTGKNTSKLYKKIYSENYNYKINKLNKSNNYSNLSSMLKDKININHIKSDPRIKRNKRVLFIKRNNKENIGLNTSNSLLSPSFHFKNGIINKNISFRTEENNIKENELYRNTKELNEKYKQIQTRKNRSKKKNNNSVISKSIDTNKIYIKSDIESQLSQIRKYMKSIKKEKKEKTKFNNNNNNKELIRNKFINYFNRTNKNKNEANSNKLNLSRINNDGDDINKNKNKDSFNKTKKNIYYSQAFFDNKKSYNISSNQNYYYFYNNKIKENNNINNYKIFLIKNISTNDHRINISIHYYYLQRKNKSLIKRYNNLSRVNNLTINYIYNNITNNSNNYIKKNGVKLKHKLSSIKEENDNILFNEKKK